MKKRLFIVVFSLILIFNIVACQGDKAPTMVIEINQFVRDEVFNIEPKKGDDGYTYNFDNNIPDDNYRNYYEIFVREFYDSDGDGIGDLNGVTEKLDYLSDLGITGIWLMPINPSPSYHKYDVLDYKDIDEQYGTMEDMDNLIAKCKEKNIKLIIDLVINHTAKNHPWFSNAVEALKRGDTENKYVKYYNINNKGGSKYYSNGLPSGWYYEGWFWDMMPDLNMDSEDVKNEIKDIVSFWLEKGIDGFRLDAAMHIYRANNDKNIEFWKWFTDYCKSINPNVYTVAEVWDSSTTIENYYGSGLTSVFNYPMSNGNGLFVSSVTDEEVNGFNASKEIENWQNKISKKSESAIDAPFLSNHDNGRSAAFYRKNLYAVKLGAALYMLAPGNPFIYYGEEIGMLGSGKDENKRAPMYWDMDETKNCEPPPYSDDVERFFPSANIQTNANNLIYSTYKRILSIKNQNPEIARGKFQAIDLGNGEESEFMAYSCTYNNSKVTIIHNLSKSPKSIKLSKSDLGYSEIRGYLNPTGENFSISNESYIFPAFATIILK